MRIPLGLAACLAFSCSSTPHKTPAPAYKPSLPTIHVVASFKMAEGGGREARYFTATELADGSVRFDGSPSRLVSTTSGPELPPKFSDDKPSLTTRVPTRAQWLGAIDALKGSPEQFDKWTALLHVAPAPLSVLLTDKRLSRARADYELGPRLANDITVTIRGNKVVASAILKLRKVPTGRAMVDDANPRDTTLRLRVELERDDPMATRGWLRLDEIAAGPSNDTTSQVLAWCADPKRARNYDAPCLPADVPVLVPPAKRERAASYVGAKCAPRVAALRETMKTFPHEAATAKTRYALARATAGTILRKSGFELDASDAGLASPTEKRLDFALKFYRRRRSDAGKPVELLLRVPAAQPVQRAVVALTAMLQAKDVVTLVVRDPRPRSAVMVPDAATRWVKDQVQRAMTAKNMYTRMRAVGRLATSSYGVCSPLIHTLGTLPGAEADRRERMFATQVPAAVLACKCQGVDIDGIDAFARQMAVADPKRVLRGIRLPLTSDAKAPALVLPKTATGQQLVDRVSKLSAAERSGVRLVFK